MQLRCMETVGFLEKSQQKSLLEKSQQKLFLEKASKNPHQL